MWDIIGSVAGVLSAVLDAGKCLSAPIERQFMYLNNYKSIIDNLGNDVEKLKDARDEVKDKVVDAENNSEKIKQTVQKWQEDANSIVHDAEKLIGEKANNRCFKGFCPNLIARHKHSREAWKKSEVIGRLLQEQEKFNKVSRPTHTQEIWLISEDDYDQFESRESTLKNIVNALNDKYVNRIGVCGTGGIGKTTMVKEIGRQVKKNSLFDEVVFVEVTNTPDIPKIQTQLGAQLHLTFNKEAEIANKLHQRLKKKDRKTLIILDNIWDEVDLKTIGIPSGVDHGCKLLLTSRNRQVLQKMDSQVFQIGNLTEEDAWSLFKKMAGDFIEKGELKSLAQVVCTKCGGLPVAIVSVAKALKNKSHPSIWREAIRQFERPSPENFEGDLKPAYLSIELSYKFLRGMELKKTFLLCSLLEHEASILDLLKYAMGLNIFESIYTMEEARDKVYALILELKDSCLLLNGLTSQSFSMHDFIREVAISIANRDDHVFNVRNENEWEWPDKDTLKKCSKIFIRSSNIEISEILECPQLESFFMNTRLYPPHVRFPGKFFTGMTKLKVLHLVGFGISSMRSSFRILENLQTLCLDYCQFRDVAIIGELKELKILSLRSSWIEKLPREIGQLTKLRMLDVSCCIKLKVIAPDVMPRLPRLEELYMRGSPIQWEVINLEELKNLSKLTTLEVDIKDDKMLPKGFFSKELKRYNLIIGDHERYSVSFGYKYVTLRTLKLKRNSIIWSEEWQKFKNVEFLCLDTLQNIENLFYVEPTTESSAT